MLHSVFKVWCFLLRAALVPDQSTARGVSANFEVGKAAKKIAKEAPLNDCYNSVLAPAPGLGENIFLLQHWPPEYEFLLEWQNLLPTYLIY